LIDNLTFCSAEHDERLILLRQIIDEYELTCWTLATQIVPFLRGI